MLRTVGRVGGSILGAEVLLCFLVQDRVLLLCPSTAREKKPGTRTEWSVAQALTSSTLWKWLRFHCGSPLVQVQGGHFWCWCCVADPGCALSVAPTSFPLCIGFPVSDIRESLTVAVGSPGALLREPQLLPGYARAGDAVGRLMQGPQELSHGREKPQSRLCVMISSTHVWQGARV